MPIARCPYEDVSADGIPHRSFLSRLQGGDVMMWQIAEYKYSAYDGQPMRIAIIQQEMSQSEAVARAQRMNDAVNTEKTWFVAERMWLRTAES
jgi:hypothetical protein